VKVLLDHNLPHKLRTNLGKARDRHRFLYEMGELKNGKLLRMAEDNGIDVLVTGDRSMVYEQNLTGRQLAIVALSTNNWPIIKNYVSQILATIESAIPGSFQVVDCGVFSRKKTIDE
jgi:hypothetical protein